MVVFLLRRFLLVSVICLHQRPSRGPSYISPVPSRHERGAARKSNESAVVVAAAVRVYVHRAGTYKDGRKGTVTRHSSKSCIERNGSGYICCTARDMTGLLLAGKRCTYSSVYKRFIFPSRESESEQGPIGCCIPKHIYRQGQRDAAIHGDGFRLYIGSCVYIWDYILYTRRDSVNPLYIYLYI